eukprot:GFYU01004895.1.p1 GENE.GFYU01004895.1~~GFYU01004895.1.p1  ORF type:complete len:413 (-),score=88.86 GFYU01004895.1:92-1330(-)
MSALEMSDKNKSGGGGVTTVEPAAAASNRNSFQFEDRESRQKRVAEFLKKDSSVRIMYIGLVVLSMAIALVLRDSPPSSTLSTVPDNECEDDSCRGKLAVLRIAFALTLFFTFMFMVTLDHDPDSPGFRLNFHSGWWFTKAIIYGLLIMISFFMPNDVFLGYANASLYLSALFILFQVILLLDFAYAWNESWVKKGRDEGHKWMVGIMIASVIMYILSLVFWIISYAWYTDGEGCGMNVAFITVTIIFAIILTLLSIKMEHGALLPTAVVVLYCSFLCWSAINGQPITDDLSCRTVASNEDAQLGFGLTFAFISLGWAAFNVSANADRLALSESQDLSQKLWVQHVINGFACMYMAMLMIGWQIDGTEQELRIGEGITSMWVKIITEWVTISLYLWSLIAPLICKNREFGSA